MVGKIKRKLLHEAQKLYKIQISVSICKVELRHSHAHSFTCGLRLFHFNSRVEEWWQRPYSLQSWKRYVALYKKSFPILWPYRSLAEKEADLSPCSRTLASHPTLLADQGDLQEACPWWPPLSYFLHFFQGFMKPEMFGVVLEFSSNV